MKIKLPSSIASSQDLADLILEVSEYARWFEHESIKVQVNVKHVLKSPTLSPGATELIHGTESKGLNQQILDNLVKSLKEYSKTSSTITVTLAAPATNDIKANLVSWFRKNIKSDILINFRFNSILLGGMVVSCGSHIFDWSFRRQILAAKGQFPGVLRRV